MLFVAGQSTGVAAPLRVSIVLSERSAAYQELGGELKRLLPADYHTSLIDSPDERPVADIYVAVGMKAAEALAEKDRPVLNVLLPRAGFEKLKRAPSHSYSAIFVEQPIQRQLALIASVLPRSSAIGVLYTSPPAELAALRKAANNMQFDLHERQVDSAHPLAGELSDLLRVSDVLMVLPDNTVYRSDTIRNILLETYRAKVPMIGLSAGYVRAGALCAIYSTPQQIAYQAAQAIEDFADTGRLPAPQYTKEFDISVNTQVARSLGVPAKDAVQLRMEVRRMQ